MPHIIAGSLLRVDLGGNSLQNEAVPDRDVQNYLLGSGLAAKIYYDEMDPDLDPLAPSSPLLAFNGLLTGTFAPTGCRSRPAVR